METEEKPFNVLNHQVQEIKLDESSESVDVKEAIEAMIASSPVFVFMKGNSQFPQCGFSANTIAVLNQLSVDFNTFDVLSHPEIREGIKSFSNWPTIPQVYVNGEFIGGNDIVTDMFQRGELQKLVQANT